MNTLQSYLTSATVWARTFVHAIIAGTASALGMHFTDAKDFDFVTPAGITNLKHVAIGGAALAIIHLFIDAPKPTNGAPPNAS